MPDDESTRSDPPDRPSPDVVEMAVGALHALLGNRPEERSSTASSDPSGEDASSGTESDTDPDSD